MALSSIELRLPPGMTVTSHPKALALTDRCLTFSGKWTRTASGARYEQRFSRTCTELPAAGYPGLQATVGKLKRYFASEVVMALGKVKADKARGKRRNARKKR